MLNTKRRNTVVDTWRDPANCTESELTLLLLSTFRKLEELRLQVWKRGPGTLVLEFVTHAEEAADAAARMSAAAARFDDEPAVQDRLLDMSNHFGEYLNQMEQRYMSGLPGDFERYVLMTLDALPLLSEAIELFQNREGVQSTSQH